MRHFKFHDFFVRTRTLINLENAYVLTSVTSNV